VTGPLERVLPSAIDRATASHYTWGDGCDGWRLLAHDGLSVIAERVPHRPLNRSTADVVFLVISSPTTIGDREEL
jgi:uncharacterized RmlC-like cupin family protein